MPPGLTGNDLRNMRSPNTGRRATITTTNEPMPSAHDWPLLVKIGMMMAVVLFPRRWKSGVWMSILELVIPVSPTTGKRPFGCETHTDVLAVGLLCLWSQWRARPCREFTSTNEWTTKSLTPSQSFPRFKGEKTNAINTDKYHLLGVFFPLGKRNGQLKKLFPNTTTTTTILFFSLFSYSSISIWRLLNKKWGIIPYNQR